MRSSRPGDPRAKRLSQRDPRLSAATWRELDRYAEAASAFTAACDERTGLGLVDECYGDLVFHAGAVIRALIADGARGRPSSASWATDAMTAEVDAYVAGKHAVGDAPERDVHIADLALCEARALPTREQTRDELGEDAREDGETGRRAV